MCLLLQWDALESDSDQEEQARHGGSLPGRSPNINRSRIEGHNRLFADYFAMNPVFTAAQFRRRFRMGRNLFLRIHDSISDSDMYFQQRPDAAGVMGLSSIQKITAALRLMAYGSSADSLDENLRMGESTILLSLERFAAGVIRQFGEEYLRYPTAEDIKRILTVNAARGPLECWVLDCMHWEWKNCPKAWAGMYQGRYKKPTIVLEAVATQDLRIWHAFLGMPGSSNDINVLDRLLYLKILFEVRHHVQNTLSTAINTRTRTCSPTEFTQAGQRLSKRFLHLSATRRSYLPKFRKPYGRMWSGRSAFFKHVSVLSIVLASSGMQTQ